MWKEKLGNYVKLDDGIYFADENKQLAFIHIHTIHLSIQYTYINCEFNLFQFQDRKIVSKKFYESSYTTQFFYSWNTQKTQWK